MNDKVIEDSVLLSELIGESCNSHYLTSEKIFSVAHYTSLNTLCEILNSAIKNNGDITLHLSLQTTMNDPYEGNFVLNSYLTKSARKKNITSNWKQYYQSNMPFIFSTVLSTAQTRDTGAIPMWKLYGDDFRGVLIKFDGPELKKYAQNNSINGIRFEECRYLNITERGKLITKLNKLPISNNPNFLKDLLRISCLVKHSLWSYENEFRIIKFATLKDSKFKSTPRGITQYIELTLPVSCITAIMLGPNCPSSPTIQSLEAMKEKINLHHPGKASFKIIKSKLQIR